MRALLLAFAFVLAASGASAAGAEALEAAWRAWAADGGVRVSTFAVIRRGEVVRQAGIGGPAESPRPLASLSKAITGACVLSLRDAGRLRLTDTAGGVLGPQGYRMTEGAARITVAELLTHSSGLSEDSTQGRAAPLRAQGGDRTQAVAAAALARSPGAKAFVYNNENYAVLGAMIEAVTGQPAGSHCPARLGLPARLSATYGGGAAWGGWEMSAPDFARFAAGLRPSADWPTVPMARGAVYGPGVIVLDGGARGQILTHTGSWCVLLGQSGGAYFFQVPGRRGVVVTWSGCQSEARLRALDEALAAAF